VSQAQADVLVIGSGFGGSVVANRLALAGKRVLVLERGPWRDSLPVRSMGIARRSPFPLGRQALTHFLRSVQAGRFSLRLNKTGMYEIVSFPGLYALAASAVGGGSTAYGGLLVPPINKAIWRERHPELDPAHIERYYDKVISDMGGVRLTRAHPLPLSIWDHFPEAAGGRCHPAEQQPYLGALLPATAAEAGAVTTFGPAGVQRQYCAFDGDAFLGSPGGAKASVDFVYLAPVLDHGVTVRDLCEVTGIARARPVDGGGYLVKFRDLANGAHDQVQARQVVLAAGTLNTLRLLFAGARQPDGLAQMPALGRSFYGNGDLIAAWINPATPVSTFKCSTTHGEFTVDGHEAHHFGIAGLAGFDTWPIPAFVKRKLESVFFMYAMGSDSGNASITYANGRLGSDYDYRKEPVYDDLRQAYRVIAAETGHRVIAMRKPLTPHMSGGARLGANVDEGVVDHRGEIYCNPGLYVADAAALPAAPGGPPSVAIAAWAHHVANGIAQSG
jgi:cholesterol oxidase